MIDSPDHTSQDDVTARTVPGSRGGLVSGDLWVTSLDAKDPELTRRADGHLLLIATA